MYVVMLYIMYGAVLNEYLFSNLPLGIVSPHLFSSLFVFVQLVTGHKTTVLVIWSICPIQFNSVQFNYFSVLVI